MLFRWGAQRLVIERDGGVWARSPSHASPTHILRDMEKSNAAQLLGFKYLRYTPQQLDSGAVLDELRLVLKP